MIGAHGDVRREAAERARDHAIAERHAAQIAAHGQSPAPQAIEAREVPDFYPVSLPSISTLPDAKLALLRRIKQAFDPAGVLNPGTIFDLEATS